jgi:AbrB family looped-hinge helix DNA binding protein
LPWEHNTTEKEVGKRVFLLDDFIIDHTFGGRMATTTISPKFQAVIPKEIREQLHLKSGRKMTAVVKGEIFG